MGHLRAALRRCTPGAVVFLMLGFFVVPRLAEAQQTGKVYRIGVLLNGPRINKAFGQGLRELGYVEGQNIVIERRSAGGKVDRFPELAAELVRLKVDCMLTVGIAATQAAKQASSTIPVVMGNYSGDPVQDGLIASLARPGGNVTGVFDVMSDLAGKRLELLKETLPKLTRIAHLSASNSPAAAGHLEETAAAARALGVGLQPLEVQGPDDLEHAFRSAVEGDADALIVAGVGFFIPHRQSIVNLEVKYRLPAMHTHGRWVSAGGLMSYTTDSKARYRRAATYVDRILKGAKPADLPVERPKKFNLIVNLKTAKAFGITIPPTILIQATKVIQ